MNLPGMPRLTLISIRFPRLFLALLKGSQQAGLTGLKGSIVRKVAVDKTRASLERALGANQQRLETRTDGFIAGLAMEIYGFL